MKIQAKEVAAMKPAQSAPAQAQNAVVNHTPQLPDAEKLERVLIKGDLSVLNDQEKVVHYKRVCDTLGLNALTKPFDYITLNGKMVLYATKAAADQLRKIYGISVKILDRKTVDGVYMVTAAAQTPNGRVDEDMGAVNIAGLKGEAFANATMKAETKAKRRVTLSICGLGMLDETEVEDIPARAKGNVFPEQPSALDGVQPACYVISNNVKGLGNMPIDRADPVKLREAVTFLENHAKKMGKDIPAWAAEFIKEAEPYIAAFENEQGT